ncbi:hypothetical protein R1sor_017628 [Riccia sorocarpa]|uniref:PLAT domain-containing protein n=1 Tax=Riccia sorocarpa TaxID=122646 RepID=A0ABD3I7S8_9MARC
MGNCSDQSSLRFSFLNFVSLTLLMFVISQEVAAATAGGGQRSIRLRDYDCTGGSSSTTTSRSGAVIHRRMDAQIQTSDAKDMTTFEYHVKTAVVAAAGSNLPDHHHTRKESRIPERMGVEGSPLAVDFAVPGRMNTELSASSVASNDVPLRRSLCTYTITTETGRKFGAGTDSTISLSLYNQNEDRVYFPSLDNGNNNFEKGHIDTFEELGPCVENICKLVLSTDNTGLFSDWFVENVNFSVSTPISGHQEKRWTLHQWLPANDASAALFIMKDDCSAVLPPSSL